MPRVAPFVTSYASVSLGQATTSPVSSPTVDDLCVHPETEAFQQFASQLRPHLQWSSAVEVQMMVVRNVIVCVFCAEIANACHYSGNIFSFKSSTAQTLPELMMAALMWTVLLHCGIILMAHVPMLMSQRFLDRPEYQPQVWFCAKKLMKESILYFILAVGSVACTGLLVQHTSLMDKYFRYKLHFYLGDICSITYTAGITHVTRRIYYQETCQGRERRLAVKEKAPVKDSSDKKRYSKQVNSLRKNSAELRDATKLSSYPKASFWHSYVSKMRDCLLVALAGGYIHVVSWYRISDRGTVVVMGFTAASVLLKLALQEVARSYVLNNGIRSIRTMCVLVGVPTVLIDTQARIVLLGTQTSTFLVVGTFAMAIAEVCLRAGKAAFVVWTIHRRANAVQQQMKELIRRTGATNSENGLSASLSALRLEFELWRRQVLSYHTAEITADMYAEYIAIGCSQSIVFWYVGHARYPGLQPVASSGFSEIDFGRWRMNQIILLGFQCVVEVFVDYICVVMEMAAGIDFERIKGLSVFLCMLFMTMAVLNISISSTVYLC